MAGEGAQEAAARALVVVARECNEDVAVGGVMQLLLAVTSGGGVEEEGAASSAVVAAAERGHGRTVAMVLEAGQGRRLVGGPALEAALAKASCKGSVATLWVLLQASVKAGGASGGAAPMLRRVLAQAAGCANLALVTQLLAVGVGEVQGAVGEALAAAAAMEGLPDRSPRVSLTSHEQEGDIGGVVRALLAAAASCGCCWRRQMHVTLQVAGLQRRRWRRASASMRGC